MKTTAIALSVVLCLSALATDEAALLAAIQKNPDEDTPRLIYADWLDEHGTTPSQHGRAEFIRLQIALSNRSDTQALEYRQMEAKAAVLFMQFEKEWTPEPLRFLKPYGSLPPSTAAHSAFPPTKTQAIWRRGFIERVSLTSRELSRSVAEALDSLPALDHLDYMTPTLDTNKMDTILSLACLSRLRGFSHHSLGPRHLRQAILAKMTNVERLYLMGSALGDGELADLVKGPRAEKLRVLALANAAHDQVSALWEKNDLKNLETLGLSRCDLTDIAQLRPPTLPALRYVDLRATTAEEVTQLSNLPHFRKLSQLKLNFRDDQLTDTLLDHIAARADDLIHIEVRAGNRDVTSFTKPLHDRLDANRARLCAYVVSAFQVFQEF